ncbi:hypothetical protein MRX96_054019, partial [Rhipicephalus microplus]
VTWLTFH